MANLKTYIQCNGSFRTILHAEGSYLVHLLKVRAKALLVLYHFLFNMKIVTMRCSRCHSGSCKIIQKKKTFRTGFISGYLIIDPEKLYAD